MSRGHVFFVTYGGGHVDIVSRVASHMHSKQYKILALTTAAFFLKEKGLDSVQCSNYISYIPEYMESVDLGKVLADREWNASSHVSYEESCAYLGVSMHDLIKQAGSEKAWRSYEKSGRKAFCPVAFAKSVLKIEKPSVVVVTCMVRMEKAFVLAAKELGITTVLIEDLFGYSMLGEGSVYKNCLVEAESAWADYVLVWNRFVKQRFISAGFPKNRVVVTGQPVLSECVEEYASVSCDALNIIRSYRSHKEIIVYFGPARRDVFFKQVEAIRKCAEKNNSMYFIVKLHPSMGLDEASKVFSLKHDKINFVVDIPPVYLLKISSKVLVFRSTVGLMSILCNVPLFVLDHTGEEEVLPYVSSGKAILIDKYDEMALRLLEEPLNTKVEMFENPPCAALKIRDFLIEKVTSI